MPIVQMRQDYQGVVLRFLIGLLLAAFALALPIRAGDIVDGKLNYRGFTVDMSKLQSPTNLDEIERYSRRQLDIVADSGVYAPILGFFRTQKIVLKSGSVYWGGVRNVLEMDADPRASDRPVFFLQQLLRAAHRALPGGVDNTEVNYYYQEALRLYPSGSNFLKDREEFFAVTASLYLCGRLDRPPYTRDVLKSKQPAYCAWLAKFLGVAK